MKSAITDCGGRIRCRDVLRTSILMIAGVTIFWLEQALNLTFTVFLIALVIGLIWISVMVAISTSFLWLPLLLVCLPLLTTVAILLRMTRLRDILNSALYRLGSEPLKSKLWTRFFLELSQK